MGQKISKYYDEYAYKQIVLLGIDAVGKTTMLYKLNYKQIEKCVPTIGFNLQTTKYQSLKLFSWNLGGCYPFSYRNRAWKPYFEKSIGIIFVIDSTDRDRIVLSKSELDYLLANDNLKDCILLVFANKQDLNDAMTTKEIIEKFDLEKLNGQRKWMIQGTDATKGEGLNEGLEWMQKNIFEKK